MMKVSYKNRVPVVTILGEDGYTAMYPLCTRCVPEKQVSKTQFVSKKTKPCTRCVPDFLVGYIVSPQQPADVPVYPPLSGYTVAGCGPRKWKA